MMFLISFTVLAIMDIADIDKAGTSKEMEQKLLVKYETCAVELPTNCYDVSIQTSCYVQTSFNSMAHADNLVCARRLF